MTMTSYKPLRLALLLAASSAILAACGSGGKKDEDAAKPTALVTTAAVETAALADGVTAYGVVEVAPNGEHSLVAPVEAVVADVLTTPGVTVKAGQTLVRLSPSPQSAIDLKKSGADYDVAHRALERALRLRGSGLASDGDVETARAAEFAAAETHKSIAARIATMEALKAPADGVIETLTVAPGDQVAAGAAIGKLGESAALRVRLNLDPTDAAKVHQGATVTLKAAGGDTLGEGAVSAVSNRIDPQTHLASAWVTTRARLAPGQPVEGVIAISRTHNPAVPRAALVYEDETAVVYVIDKSVAHKRAIKLGAEDGDKAVVLDGLKPGERVAVEGAAVLEDGMAVREAAKP